MTTDDRLERVLPDVLEHLAPSRAPDRLRLEILSTTSRTRPRPRWFVSPTRHPRFPTMTSTLRLGVLGAVALALGLLAGPLFLFSGSPGPSPSPVPSPIPSPRPIPSASPIPSPGPSSGPTPRPQPIPTELGWWWNASVRDLPEMGTDPDRAILKFEGPNSAWILTGASDAREGVMVTGITGDGKLWLRNQFTDANGCPKGSEGFYDWTLSPDGHTLTILDGTDTCDARARYLAGDWNLFDCRWVLARDGVHGSACAGQLEPGTHTSSLFMPRGSGGPAWTGRPGGLTFEASAGWANALDTEADYFLMPTSEYDPTGRSDMRSLSWILVGSRPTAMDPLRPCDPARAPGVGRSASELAAWVKAHPGLTVTDEAALTIDGHPAIVLDVDLDPGGAARCTDDGTVDLFGYDPALNDDGSWKDDHAYYWWSVGEPHRIILLDLGGGDTIVIDIRSSDPADQSAFVEQAMPIVESMRFAD